MPELAPYTLSWRRHPGIVVGYARRVSVRRIAACDESPYAVGADTTQRSRPWRSKKDSIWFNTVFDVGQSFKKLGLYQTVEFGS